ncbi:Sulfatase-like protein, partial [Globisporangium splendens]
MQFDCKMVLTGLHMRVQAALIKNPWLNWGYIYGSGMLFFFSCRYAGLHTFIEMFGLEDDDRTSTKVAGLFLGALEDLACLNYLVLLLWLFDLAVHRACCEAETRDESAVLFYMKRVLRFVMYLIGFLLFAFSVVANDLLVRTPHTAITIVLVVAIAFSLVSALWIDLSRWNPLRLLSKRKAQTGEQTYTLITTPDVEAPSAYTALELGTLTVHQEKKSNWFAEKMDKLKQTSKRRIVTSIGIVLLVFLALPAFLIALTQHGVTPAAAGVALNTSASELFRIIVKQELLPVHANGDIESADSYLDASIEEYSLFEADTLFRRTTGFKGDLAFNVTVDPSNPPNILVLVVESFRYHDSQYLATNNTYLFKNQKNLAVTPNFDRWAKRGIAFRNMWSSWRTSRSTESILFGQLPLDSATKAGTTGGSKSVKLSGMPQFFKAKGYESIFAGGCRTDYDQWNRFLPSHGFDEVLDVKDFKKLAEKDLGIGHEDWALPKHGGEGRAMSYWGFHDDVAMAVLANILTNETDEQRARMRNSEPKKPFFINHYTISSHTPYKDRPLWYDDDYPKPDFKPLYEHEAHNVSVKRYLEMRYLTDMALGKFFDRMEQQGVLNDTIVVIVGDHGQGPENGLDVPESREISATRVAAAIIAEGRLGKCAGMLFDDAAEQYDLLNTLADIVGVPSEGFLQHGAGRSLKRKIPFSERVVWSNNPTQKMSVVRGHERLQYDAISNAIALHNADADHDMKYDLYPSLSKDQQAQWLKLRDAGRQLNAYYKKRWGKKCLLQADY